MGLWIWLGSIAVMGGVCWWIRRRGMEVEDYYEREYQDPPTFDAGGFLGGDRF
ncbi:MAG: hypothetical protein PVG83_14540 [Acidimicrobiia bacterium]